MRVGGILVNRDGEDVKEEEVFEEEPEVVEEEVEEVIEVPEEVLAEVVEEEEPKQNTGFLAFLKRLFGGVSS